MSKSLVSLLFSVAALFVPVTAVQAADALKASPIIFDSAHMKNTNDGDEIVYDFARNPSDETQLGLGFKDKITLKVGDQKDGKKALDLQIYTGKRARDLQKFTDMTINPVFVVAMQQAVASFRAVGGGDFSYLKNRFTLNLDEKSVVEPVKIDYKGQTVDAYKISFEPFKGDPSAARMRGYDISTFTMIVSPSVPGEFVETISVMKSSTAGSPNLEERTTLAGYGGVK
jgi:hypothetical protein